MSKEVELRFVDENDFETLGKCYFLSDNSSWENASISLVSGDSLDGISDFSEELVSDSGDSSDSDLADDDYVQEASTSKGSRRGKNFSDAKEKEKGCSAYRKREKKCWCRES